MTAAPRKITVIETRERADVYPPRPTSEQVDRVELREELMRRFSKTLAELAK